MTTLLERCNRLHRGVGFISTNPRVNEESLDRIYTFAQEIRKEAFITGYKRAKADACFCLDNCDDIYIQACAEQAPNSQEA